jgi:hypothetical protein
MHQDPKEWAVEVYKGDKEGNFQGADQEDGIEIELDEEEAVESSRVLGIAVYYSKKSYNPQVLFSDMINAWHVKELNAVEKLGDYMFKIEFFKEEDMARVLEGGAWRHKGDALLVAHYDGLLRPSEIRIQSIRLWIRLCDLPAAMMKQGVAQQLGTRLGEFLKSDTRFPGYLRVQVRYPLGKPLQTLLVVKVKGRGHMVITLRYENVPHCCFLCRRIGHTATNYEYESEEHGVAYGEELRASPPRRTKEIAIKPAMSKVVRPLFQVTDMPSRSNP